MNEDIEEQEISAEALKAAHDASDNARTFMQSVCRFVFNGGSEDFYKARGMSDAYLTEMYTALGREETRKIVDGMREHLDLIKDD